MEQPLKPLMRLDLSLGPDAVAGAISALPISPDGNADCLSDPRSGREANAPTRLLNQSAIKPLPGTENGAGEFLSPDGQWVGFFADSALKKVSLHGGPPVTISDAGVYTFGASWGENGLIVTSWLVEGGLTSVPASGGRSNR
jgi:hypothetical protein